MFRLSTHTVSISMAQLNSTPQMSPAPLPLGRLLIILLAMLAAPGTSVLRNVYSINRGYEGFAERLNTIGAEVQNHAVSGVC